MQRLREAVLAVPADELRTAIRTMGEQHMAALPAQARPLAAQLKRSKTPGDLLRRAPHQAIVLLLADELADECLEAIRVSLGDAADDPNREQLVAALDEVLEKHPVHIVRLVLGSVAIGDAEASDLCDALLTEDERFAL